MKKRSSLVGAVVVALAGIAVGLASAAMMNRAHPPAVARFPARGSYGFTFRYPASWRRVACRLTDGSFLSTPITLLTTTPSISACRQSADLRLGPNGVVVEWWTFGNMTADSITRFRGQDTRIGGRAARVSTSPATRTSKATAWCARMGGSRTIDAAISRPQRGNWLLVDVCLRGPNLTAGEAATRKMLSSLQFTALR